MSIAVISGGMGGIGKATATSLASKGFTVIILAHKDSPDINHFLSTLTGTGHSYYICDVSKEKEVLNVIEKIIDINKNIDIFIHSAVDPIIRKSALNMSSEEFRSQFETGLFGGFNLFSKIGNIMKNQKSGLIIGITTKAIEQNMNPGNMAGYVSSKFALRGLLRELYRELSKYNVKVNAVSPDFVPTKLNSDLPERLIDFVKEMSPDKKITSPEDVADTICFLCSKEADNINGISISVLKKEQTKL